jgi:hypothetical protein
MNIKDKIRKKLLESSEFVKNHPLSSGLVWDITVDDVEYDPETEEAISGTLFITLDHWGDEDNMRISPDLQIDANQSEDRAANEISSRYLGVKTVEISNVSFDGKNYTSEEIDKIEKLAQELRDYGFEEVITSA